MHCDMSNPISQFIANFLFPKKNPAPVVPGKLVYDISEAAVILNIPERQVYEQIKQGKIHAVQISRHGNYRILGEEIERIQKK